eukprot:Rmarinus@m.24778
MDAELAPSGFSQAFFASLAVVIASEIGDKTFFIAAVLAMKHPRLQVFGAALAALALMTVLSAAFGYIVPNLIPRDYTHYAATLLFFVFGVMMLRDGYGMAADEESEELVEVEAELSKKDLSAADAEEGRMNRRQQEENLSQNPLACIMSPIFAQAFTMTFLAEWGDRSQITTVALAAAKDPYGVTVGGILGHSICTGMAVIGGKLLAERISEKAVTLCGGVLFLFFAVLSLYQGPEEY